ncbi:kxDL motif-containing protein 1 [Otolemur garnettii]|uniref:kxDL motif-containing protein 1 n=1 Tax=Otolemur garnettii TaxID=30611 RepID=UPI000C7E9D3F|nr:kxDL motif-containing protein 1 [Otolemur garnettii]
MDGTAPAQSHILGHPSTPRAPRSPPPRPLAPPIGRSRHCAGSRTDPGQGIALSQRDPHGALGHPRPPRLGNQVRTPSPAFAVHIGSRRRACHAHWLTQTSVLGANTAPFLLGLCSRILSMVNADDVNAIILAQKNIRLQQMSERFLHHTRTLVEMKRDLDSIFRRIRTLKGKLARQHPEAFSHIPEASLLEDEDEDPILPSTTTTIATSEQSTGSCDTSPDTVSPSLSPGFEDLSHVRPSSPAVNGRSQTDDEEMLGE